MRITENILLAAFVEMVRDDDTMKNSWWSVGAWNKALSTYYDFDDDVMKIDNRLLSIAISRATGIHTVYFDFKKPERQKCRFFYEGKDPVLLKDTREAEPFRKKSNKIERKRQQYWPVSIANNWKRRIANGEISTVDTQLAVIRRQLQ